MRSNQASANVSDIASLRSALAELQRVGRPTRAECRVFGDAIRRGAVHEWYAPENGALPLTPLLAVALEACAADAAGSVVWIGRRCWPSPVALAQVSQKLLRRSLLVHPAGKQERVWAMDLALRSRGATVVVADASRLRFNDTRRLQLAAEAGAGLGLLIRPEAEASVPSAAATRWRVTPTHTDDSDPRWTAELVRCKGLRPTHEEARQWAVQWRHATRNVRVAPHAPGRNREAEAPTRQRRAN